MFPRDVLNRVLWAEGRTAFDELVIYYISRGAPDDTTIVMGCDIQKVGRDGIELQGVRYGHIPYHRIFRIERRGETLYDREVERASSEASSD